MPGIDKEQVKADYLNGMKQKELIQKYNIPLNTLKSWIKRYHWSEEKKGAPKKGKKGAPQKKKKGAQPGNKNAVGHGAPYGNQNAVKHGFYCAGFYQIPYTPENIKVFEFMNDNGFENTVENFNACKKLLNRLNKIEKLTSKERR